MPAPAQILTSVKFDFSIRMYGEDLEFQLRLGRLSHMGSSGELGLKHCSSSINRESARIVTCYADGFRWRLHQQFPTLVWGPVVILSSLLLFFGNLVHAFVSWCPETVATALGHGDFLFRLVQRKQVEQQIRP